jgi:aryl-alcohol dehydrogenase-like predicted oxidoreductase
MRLEMVDVLFLHNLIVPDALAGQVAGTPLSVFREVVRPAFERLVAAGTIRCWAISAFGVPSAVIELIRDEPRPAAIQAVSNVLDAVGVMPFDEPPRPREIITTAAGSGVAVMGVRAVHAGALTDAIDRPLRDDHPLLADFERAAPFREVARELGTTAAALAHRYALSMAGVTTVVLGVKNRAELRECVAAAEAGPLEPDLLARLNRLREV